MITFGKLLYLSFLYLVNVLFSFFFSWCQFGSGSFLLFCRDAFGKSLQYILLILYRANTCIAILQWYLTYPIKIRD